MSPTSRNRAAISVSRQRRHSPKKSAASSPGTATITVAERPGMAPVTSIVEGAGFTIAEASASAIRFVPRWPLLPGLYDVEIAWGSRWLSNVSFDFEYGGDNRAQLRAVPLAYLGRGRYRSVCDVPEPLQAIVVRTDARGERLSIAGFRVALLGPLARLRLLGGRALELLRRDPRALFAAFRRSRAGRVRRHAIVSPRCAEPA